MTGHYSFILQICPHLALQITVSTYRNSVSDAGMSKDLLASAKIFLFQKNVYCNIQMLQEKQHNLPEHVFFCEFPL